MKLSRNGELPYYLGVFLEITHDATKELLKYNMNDIVIVLIVLIKNILRVMDFEMGGLNPSANYAVTM